MNHSVSVTAIEKYRPQLENLSRFIWQNPEGPFREYEASKATAALLQEAGFQVELGYAGLPTAIRATWGQGHPIIGFLGEYDALPGLSQKVQISQEPSVPGGFGQGCGHNLLGVAHVGAAIGLKAEMEAGHHQGTVVFYGCPAEEVLTGKGYMARGGAFQDLDVAIAFHPANVNGLTLGHSLGLNSFKFNFRGRTAHAGGDPHNGRSALDAVELTNVGANYLREHVPTDVRIHYMITNGGMAPNIVPDYAQVWYYVRAPKREMVEEVYQRLIKVAQGAAMMTETSLEIDFLGGCYPTLTNKVLANVIHEAMKEAPKEEYTEEEVAFARALNEVTPKEAAAMRKQLHIPDGVEIFNEVLPIDTSNEFGSTDVGDVGHIVPTVYFYGASYNFAAPGHSWQITACSGSTIGEKGMLFGARAMALFGSKLLHNPELVAQAQAEFSQVMNGTTYKCPIPDDLPVPGTTK